MDVETRYLSCLLMNGPPDHLGSAADKEGISYCCGRPMREQVKTLADPVSSMEYMIKCNQWFVDHVDCSKRPEVFTQWWMNYKLWLLEQGYGH